MSGESKAVFLSYASEDSEAAQRIADALKAAGIEVWFDRSELRGGDAWDRQIRQHIHDCALFVPIISASTETRGEGYFRREWKMAVERMADMAEDIAFLVPVVIDDTSDRGSRVPDTFRHVQWTRLPAGHTPPAFVERVQRLLTPGLAATRSPSNPSGSARTQPGASRSTRFRLGLVVVVVVVLGALAYLIAHRSGVSGPASSAAPMTATPAFAPPPHSLAVLPFVNMSGDPKQEYFSDGLTEELLNSLSHINSLQVAGRTSSFYFKGKDVDLGTVAHKLNVAAVLEGSVRRSGNKVRVTAQLINATTGFHVWSENYDRDIGDLLKLQTEVANAVANALRITLLGDVAGKIELRSTRNPAAFDAYLRGAAALRSMLGAQTQQDAIAQFSEAIRLDPEYALAYAERARMEVAYAQEFAAGSVIAQGMARALADANKALALAPDLAEGHMALARHAAASLEFARALEEHERSVALAPGNAQVLAEYGRFAGDIGLAEKGLAAAQRAVLLDPLNSRSHYLLGLVLHDARRYSEATSAFEASVSLNPDSPYARALNGVNEYVQGNLQRASELCKARPSMWSDLCLVITYEKLGRHSEARNLFDKYKGALGDAAAYQYAEIYAQWGDLPAALDWLEKALRLRDPGLVTLRTDPLLDPLRKEPRFQAIERSLNFPH